MKTTETPAIVTAPNAEGYWWWRKSASTEWALAEVEMEPRFKARFFNGSQITEHPWGEWSKAYIAIPPSA
jgi:hypothetical protein